VDGSGELSGPPTIGLRMTFDVPAVAYDRFMGRFSQPLGPRFADFSEVASGDRVLDVGCGPGALTSVLVELAGAESVAAIDPSESFAAAARLRHPGVDVRLASAADLPFDAASFDRALAQLVVHFMPDPVAGLREMARVTRPDGVVAACVWDHASGHGPLSVFWDAVRGIDRAAVDEADLPGARRGSLPALFRSAGLAGIEDGSLEVSVAFDGFQAWWEPFTLGVGPAGRYVAGLDPDGRARLRHRCAAALPSGPFTLQAKAWAARARAPVG
jgi:SAM-dependent methyltransferase